MKNLRWEVYSMSKLADINEIFEKRIKSENFILSKKLINKIMRLNWKCGIELTPESISEKVGLDYSTVLQIFAGESYAKSDYDLVMKYVCSQFEQKMEITINKVVDDMPKNPLNINGTQSVIIDIDSTYYINYSKTSLLNIFEHQSLMENDQKHPSHISTNNKINKEYCLVN